MFQVKKAKRQRRPLKIGLEGLSGSGKTFTALRMGFAMKRAGIGSRIVVADSENESAGLYDGINIDGEKWDYDVCPLPHAAQHPKGYTDCYDYLVGQGFDIVIMDSMTHAWKGALSKVDELGARNKGDKFGAGWRVVTPEQEQMMRVLTDGRAHLIATTRVKGEYERVEGSNGKDKIKKVGFKADQRDGMEYEYDCVVRLDPDGHHAVVEKVRGCTAMDGRHASNPGPEFWKPLFDWWLSAEEAPPPAPAPAGDKQKGAYDRAAADLKAAGAESCDRLKEVWAKVFSAGVAVFGENLFASLGLLKDDLKTKCQQQAAASKPAAGEWVRTFVRNAATALSVPDCDELTDQLNERAEELTDGEYKECYAALDTAYSRAGRPGK